MEKKYPLLTKADIVLAVILLVLGLGSMFLFRGEEGGFAVSPGQKAAPRSTWIIFPPWGDLCLRGSFGPRNVFGGV